MLNLNGNAKSFYTGRFVTGLDALLNAGHDDVEFCDRTDSLSCVVDTRKLVNKADVVNYKERYNLNGDIVHIPYDEGDDYNFISPTLEHYCITFDTFNVCVKYDRRYSKTYQSQIVLERFGSKYWNETGRLPKHLLPNKSYTFIEIANDVYPKLNPFEQYDFDVFTKHKFATIATKYIKL